MRRIVVGLLKTSATSRNANIATEEAPLSLTGATVTVVDGTPDTAPSLEDAEAILVNFEDAAIAV